MSVRVQILNLRFTKLSRSVMTYACPTWEYAADARLLKLQRLQNRALRAAGNHARCTPVRELHVTFKLPYVYGYITKSCSTQAEVIPNHVNSNVRCIEQGEAIHRKYKRLKLTAVKPTTDQLTNCNSGMVM
jgi:hypothetical protein